MTLITDRLQIKLVFTYTSIFITINLFTVSILIKKNVCLFIFILLQLGLLIIKLY